MLGARLITNKKIEALIPIENFFNEKFHGKIKNIYSKFFSKPNSATPVNRKSTPASVPINQMPQDGQNRAIAPSKVLAAPLININQLFCIPLFAPQNAIAAAPSNTNTTPIMTVSAKIPPNGFDSISTPAMKYNIAVTAA